MKIRLAKFISIGLNFANTLDIRLDIFIARGHIIGRKSGSHQHSICYMAGGRK
jgi:hypothetical protein